MSNFSTESVFFHEMLSVERTQPFVSELALPLQKEQFEQAMTIARACLEVHIFPTISLYGPFPGLIEAWRRYRLETGVIPDSRLVEIAAQQRSLWIDVPRELELIDIGDLGLVAALREWFTVNFRSGIDPSWQWPWALRYFLIVYPQG